MAYDIASLKEQLAHTESEFEQAKASLYRCDGVIALLKHMIKDAEAEAAPVVEAEPAKEA